MNVQNQYYYFKNALSKDQCQYIIDIGLKALEENKKLGYKTYGTTGGNQSKHDRLGQEAKPMADITLEEVKKSTYQGDRIHNINGNMSCLSAQGGNKLKGIGIEVDEKYYLSDKMIKGIQKSNFKERQPVDVNGVCRTLKIGGDTPCFEVNPVKLGNSEKFGGSIIIGKSESSYCLRASNNGAGVKVQNKIRRLTPTECFRLQGFPDSFVDKCREIGISDTQLYKQAGNSITVDVMEHLFREILINEKTV